ncbi:hypothetical protein KBY66_04190 [Synechococcus sp. Tobar12-5m-g]|uniref:hypothetical protein n=1 Tax=unclassified Synechococcus TaxID=2626047 RepID=UPI0020CEF296|nr:MULTISPECIES: hypothetical protein [unclassified Synechococcus]MCP9771828.1 hypothetical protein [Synechococcus sp. Tobar12-5m-g]MCP9872770.1 hypothetical protein [Synechococcus sp. Cruz CV-v-12]
MTTVNSTEPASAPGPEAPSAESSAAELIDQLSAERLWLLRQIDEGRWADLRLDLAALERELGQMLDLAKERLANR